MSTPVIWRNKAGDALLVGTRLMRKFDGTAFTAIIEVGGVRLYADGKVYSSLTAAAIAVKVLCGRKDAASQENGRTFWKMSQGPGVWVPVKYIVTEEQIQRLFDELGGST